MKMLLAIAVIEPALALILFTSAGRIDLPWVWALLGIHTLMMTSLALLLPRDLVNERMSAMRAGGPPADRAYRRVWLVLILASLVLIGLDTGRFNWTPAAPLWLHLAGLALYVLGLALCVWSMLTNCFFSSVVRVQSDRGHSVISTGPYALVRHPGYAGMMLAMLAQSAVVGSVWALIPAVLAVLVLASRARFEERFLCANLRGYSQYNARVTTRFVPRFG
jgi:protein-S-isoprenylcysteine O-methyltransferase Ste14